MTKRYFIMLAIYGVLFTFIVISMLDGPNFGDNAFSIAILTWMFYTTAKHETELEHLKDEIRVIKEKEGIK